jgi:hypothetical protein
MSACVADGVASATRDLRAQSNFIPQEVIERCALVFSVWNIEKITRIEAKSTAGYMQYLLARGQAPQD